METLASGFGLLEGPRDDGAGGALFSDVMGGGVYRCTAAGKIEQVLPKRRGIGGLVPHAEGGLVVSGRDVAHVRDGESRTVLALDGAAGFNDLSTDASGNLLVGSLRYRPLAGEDPVPGEVWQVGAGTEPAELFGDVTWANGIGVSPDGAAVYVSDYARECVLVWKRDDPAARVHARAPDGASCDGLAVDADGGLWVALGAGGGIGHYDSAGELVDVLEVPADFVSSVAFAGPGLEQLLITTVGGLLRAPAPVPGLAVAPARV
ncbi:MAG TPA: SMP-30/gluconolactonase/LRE family protein, partial [Solirubrobacteraceae bacterium]